MKHVNKIWRGTLIALIGIVLVASPVFAIVNPDNQVDYGTGTTRLYNIYENVLETGDMLIAAEVMVEYAAPPTDYTASEAFLFELLNAAGDTTLASTTLNDYGDRPISIYLSATRVDTLVLVSGTAYGLRITSNPLIGFDAPPPPDANRTRVANLAASDYVDQSTATDDNNPLRDGMIAMARNIQANDIAAGIIATEDYIIEIQGVSYLTTDGGTIFLTGVPKLSTMCPILFQAGLEVLTSPPPESTGTYALTLTPAQKWGNTVADGLTNLGVYLGINQALAGSAVLFVLVVMFAIFAYRQTQSGVSVLLLVAATPFLGAYLGLMPMALAFIFVIVIVILLGYFFFSRGAL